MYSKAQSKKRFVIIESKQCLIRNSAAENSE